MRKNRENSPRFSLDKSRKAHIIRGLLIGCTKEIWNTTAMEESDAN